MNNDLRSITEIINETVVYIRQVEQLAPILRVMLDAQQRRDMIFLADILQYEVTKILKNQ